MSENILSLKNIQKSFDTKEVLKNINLEVNKGEIVSIIGPSGSGKSTLLRCATFLEHIDGGTISYLGKDIVKTTEEGKVLYPPKSELKKAYMNFGLVFQNFNLFPHYSVIKNIVDAPIHNQNREKEEVYAQARELLDKLGLADKENAYPCELSGGQQQRVAIARALALNSKILFFDEPTSALDPEITAGILRVMKALAAEHMTMVIVTHEIDFARAVSDKVIFMDGGMVIEEGKPEDVIDHPSSERTKEFLQKLSV